MRFEPKLTEPNDCWDDEADELELPVDMAELGEQLHADAMHLAQLYPALTGNESSLSRKPDATSAENRRRSRRQLAMKLGSGVSLIVLLGVTIGIAVNRLVPEREALEVKEDRGRVVDLADDTSTSPDSSLLVVTTPNHNGAGFSELENLTHTQSFVLPRMSGAEPLSTQETSILNASGPRSEAYLDYIEMTSVRNVKLSF
jgi:hypothetical protein